MYKCKWCGKLFHTTKHNCKFSLERKNCMSCKHLKGFYEGKGDFYDPVTLEFLDSDPSCFECELHDDRSYGDLTDLSSNNWNGFCDDYETASDYKGSKSYADTIRKSEIAKHF